jgi:hypothetical protein
MVKNFLIKIILFFLFFIGKIFSNVFERYNKVKLLDFNLYTVNNQLNNEIIYFENGSLTLRIGRKFTSCIIDNNFSEYFFDKNTYMLYIFSLTKQSKTLKVNCINDLLIPIENQTYLIDLEKGKKLIKKIK